MLGHHVIHNRDQGFQAAAQRQICSQFLRRFRLDIAFHNTQAFLGINEILDALDLIGPGAHCITHDLSQFGTGLSLFVIGLLRTLGQGHDSCHRQSDAKQPHRLIQARHRRRHLGAGFTDAGLHSAHGGFGLVGLFGDGGKVSSGTHHQIFYNTHQSTSSPPKRAFNPFTMAYI